MKCLVLVDEVNYLVALKHNDEQKSISVLQRELGDHNIFAHCLSRFAIKTRNKCIVPMPGQAYHEACQHSQLIPPRYKKFFSEGSCFLPDSTALELIHNRCHYRPKEINIGILLFSSFLLYMLNRRKLALTSYQIYLKKWWL